MVATGRTWQSVPVGVSYTETLGYLYHYIEYPALYHKERLAAAMQTAAAGENPRAGVGPVHPRLGGAPAVTLWTIMCLDDFDYRVIECRAQLTGQSTTARRSAMSARRIDADSVVIGRRRFLELGVLGGGATLLALPSVGRAAGKTEALLLSCMDYRLVNKTERYMSGRKLRDKYDYVILAGASLGAVTDKYPAWNKTFWEHLDVAIQLHHIQKVMVMDHRDCGAYKVILGEDCCKDREKETAVHAEKLKELRAQINAKHSKLGVELLLMNLDGKVETIK